LDLHVPKDAGRVHSPRTAWYAAIENEGGAMKARAFFFVGAIAAWSTPVRALDPVGADIAAANNQIAASFVARRVGYDELNHGLAPALPDVLDSETGWLFGFLAEVKVHRTILGIPNLYLRPSFGYVWGSTTYDGRTQPTAPGGSHPITATSGASIYDLGLDLGIGIPLGDRAALTPMLRWTQRHWRRTLLDGQPTSYREDYEHQELGIGGLVQVAVADHVVLGVSGTVGRSFAPSIQLTPPQSTVSLDFDLGSALVVRGGVSLDTAIGAGPLHAFVAYDVLYFTYGQSAPLAIGGGTLTEPDSRTVQHDLRAGLAYSF
jgi:hypothetical protein